MTQPLKQYRLDYIIGPNAQLDLIYGCEVRPCYIYDQSFEEMNLKISQFTQGRRNWKLSLLKDKSNLIMINELINQEQFESAAKGYSPTNINKIKDAELNKCYAFPIILG